MLRRLGSRFLFSVCISSVSRLFVYLAVIANNVLWFLWTWWLRIPLSCRYRRHYACLCTHMSAAVWLNFGYYDRVSLSARLTFTMKSSKTPEEQKRDARIKLWSVRAVRLAVVLGCTGYEPTKYSWIWDLKNLRVLRLIPYVESQGTRVTSAFASGSPASCRRRWRSWPSRTAPTQPSPSALREKIDRARRRMASIQRLSEIVAYCS